MKQIVNDHWKEYGRNYYQRYDYEGLETEHAIKIFNLLEANMQVWKD